MRQKIIIGNWKMNGTSSTIAELLHNILKNLPSNPIYQCAVLPPTVYLQQTRDLLINSNILFGAQNVYPKNDGAFTGEVSGAMLADIGCKYVLVGHSERRQLFNESNQFIAEKFHHVKSCGMIPVLCVGETLSEREQGLTEKVLTKQLLSVATSGDSENPFNDCIVAYEPIWAIGTGETATPEQAQTTHSFIRKLVAEFGEIYARLLPIIYGGSVNEDNSEKLFAMPDVDGGLIGGASLDAQKFGKIIKDSLD